MSSRAPTLEVWRGAANAWNCDEMGHMNVRFYLAFALQGLAGVALALGMPDAFAPRAVSTLLPRSWHIRFLREARSGAPLQLEAGVLSFGEDEAEVLLVMRHSRSGEPCAAFVSRVVHATPDGRAFPWSAGARAAADGLACDAPDFAKAKGVTDTPAPTLASRERADALGVPVSARATAIAAECDALGRFRSDAAMGMFSDAAAQIFGAGGTRGETSCGARIGGAMLGIHILHHRWPRLGAHLELRSGLAAADPRLNHLVHWMLDAQTGDPVITARAVAAAFDLDTRKIVERTPEQLARVAPRVVEGLDQ